VNEEQATTVVTPDNDIRLTDLGNSRLLVKLAGHDLRWCGAMPGTGWMVWDKSRWVPDDTQEVVRAAMEVPDAWRRRAPPEVDDTMGMSEEESKRQKWRKAVLAHASKSESSASISAMVKLASAHENIATKKSIWDADLWAFATPDATYNLKDIKKHAPRRDEYITRMARFGADPYARCPVWDAFLLSIMAGDEEMVRFLQRAVGYCLTGSIQEQCLFIAYGRGANGKSTFMDMVTYLLGDYATSTPVETFVNRKEGAIPNDLAALAGARLVTCNETAEGGGLDESLVKLVTGGDPITARFLNREFFSFVPAFKLWMLTNHKPIVKGTDEGIWRRLRMIPFTVTIPKEERDEMLPQRLREEATGIMRWALEGLKEWRRIGLSPPSKVLEATQQYRDEMDILSDFIADCCDTSRSARGDNKRMYTKYSEWAKENGVAQRSHKWFSRALVDRGFEQEPGRGSGRTWIGIELK
jgi:putative DNA primase/helicase